MKQNSNVGIFPAYLSKNPGFIKFIKFLAFG